MSEDGTEEVLDSQQLAIQMLQKSNVIETPPTDETLGDEQESEVDGAEDVQEEETPKGNHPAWQEILSAVPEELHEALTPKLREWDAGVTRRFQEIHSQYEPYKEYEPIIEQGIDVETLSKSIGLFQALNNDPQSVYDALGQAYGFSSEQESEYEEDEQQEYTLPPQVLQQLQRQEQALEQFAEYMQRQEEQSQSQTNEQLLAETLQGLEQQYGNFDEDYVVTLIASGVDPEVAVRKFQDTIGSYSANRPGKAAPKVLSSSGGGGVPANLPDPTQLSSKDTQALVAEMLRLAQTEG